MGEIDMKLSEYDELSLKGKENGVLYAACSADGQLRLQVCSMDILPMDEIENWDWDEATLRVITMTCEWIAGRREAANLWNSIYTEAPSQEGE